MARSSREFPARLSARRHRYAGFERLEGRCFLSAAPFPAPPHLPHVHLAPFEVMPPALVADAGHAERPVEGIGKGFSVTPIADAPPVLSTTVRLNNSLSPAGETFQFKALNDRESGLPLNVPSVSRIFADGLIAADNADSQRGLRLIVWMSADPGEMGFAEGSATFVPDGRLRLTQLVRESLFEEGIVVPTADGVRAPTNHAGHDIDVSEMSRHATPGSPVGGQIVESEPTVKFARWTPGESGLNSADSDALTDSPPEAVSHLVALGGEALDKPAGKVAGDPPHVANAAASTRHDLLLPRFSCDPEALRAALAGFVSEAEELGVSLMSMLGEMSTEGEAALVAGLLGAGTAYRYARDGRRRERAD